MQSFLTFQKSAPDRHANAFLIAVEPGKRLPTNAFRAVVHRDSQLMASAKAAALQNLASVRGSHSFAETVNAQAAALFGLISSFRCHLKFLSALSAAQYFERVPHDTFKMLRFYKTFASSALKNRVIVSSFPNYSASLQ